MAVKHIQLRGISRTPSDRLTEDGGVAESLNVQLDTSEIAPALAPEDVSTKLNLPPDLQTEKLFVHKTANYENVIFAEYSDDDRVNLNIGVISNGKRKIFLTLDDYEQINDITSLGNTLIVLTNQATRYVLWRDNEYISLGTEIPFPKLKIYGDNQSSPEPIMIDIDELGIYGMYRAFDTADYNKYLNDKTNSDPQVIKLLEKIAEEKSTAAGELAKKGIFWGPVYVMYGIKLFNGTVITTVPEILSRKYSTIPDITWNLELSSRYNYNNNEFEGGISAKFNLSTFSIGVACEEDYNIAGWRDLVQSVELYVSTPIDTSINHKRIEIKEVTDINDDVYYGMLTKRATTRWGIIEEKSQVLNKGNFYRIKSWDLVEQSNDAVPRGEFAWTSLDQDVREETLLTSPYQLPSDDTEHVYVDKQSVIASKISTYNSEVLLIDGKKRLEFRGPACEYITTSGSDFYARYKFILNTGGTVYSEENIPVTSRGILTFASKEVSYAEILIRRDQRIYTTPEHDDFDIVTTYSFLKLPMRAHPNMPCSFAYIGLSKVLYEEAFDKNGSMTLEEAQAQVNFAMPPSPYESSGNKLLISDASNPFLYPDTKGLTFQSEVLGVAIATTALSQGQFGQFPLYVFTEDGIWVMETAADGSFINQKPLSRDVCINPASITSIDNGVVFVTAQGVMILQGSQVVNISPNMNGRHYVIENTPRTIIENQDFFCDLLPAISDNTHFLAFVKEATVAYDYAGRRLIFIKKDEKYQYIYKLDTQTWHKAAYDIDLVAPINSYPECLVQGKGMRSGEYAYVTKQETQEELDYIVSRIRVVLPDVTSKEVQLFLEQKIGLDVTNLSEGDREWLYNELDYYHVLIEYVAKKVESTCIYDFSTLLDAQESQTPTRGIIATRPLDLGEPDVFKTITDVRIRGQFPKGAVKFILLGSNDGINFATLSTLRGRSWKLFRIIILADLAPTERISWIDVQYETTFTNKLR